MEVSGAADGHLFAEVARVTTDRAGHLEAVVYGLRLVGYYKRAPAFLQGAWHCSKGFGEGAVRLDRVGGITPAALFELDRE